MTLFPRPSDPGAPPTSWKGENREKPPADAHEIRRFAKGNVGFHDRDTGLAYAVATTVRAERSIQRLAGIIPIAMNNRAPATGYTFPIGGDPGHWRTRRRAPIYNSGRKTACFSLTRLQPPGRRVIAMAFTYVIEEPSRLAPATEWRRFLCFVNRLPQDDEGVRMARRIAERHIAEITPPDFLRESR